MYDVASALPDDDMYLPTCKMAMQPEQYGCNLRQVPGCETTIRADIVPYSLTLDAHPLGR
jgi:hypothetical protein